MTTATATIGASKDLDFTFKDRNGAPADPTTIALTIREPDGVETAKAIGDMVKVSTGVWRYVFAVTKAGRHSVTADAGGAVEAAVQIEFYALAKVKS